MRYADVAMNSHGGNKSVFTYLVPENIPTIEIGQVVWVPFGKRQVHGIIVQKSSESRLENIRNIGSIIVAEPVVDLNSINLATWISSKYVSTLYDALALMLPPGFGFQTVENIRLKDQLGNPGINLDKFELQVLDYLKENFEATYSDLSVKFGDEIYKIIDRLITKSFLEKNVTFGKPKIMGMSKNKVFLNVSNEIAAKEIIMLKRSRAYKQSDALSFMVSISEESVLLADAKDKSGVSQGSPWNRLVQKGFIRIEKIQIRGTPYLDSLVPDDVDPPTLTPDQQKVHRVISEAIANEINQAFLLNGVTGSGKTEIYLRALSETIANGKRGIVLVPEIALTVQTVNRFSERFPGEVAVLHSGLSLRERYEEWHNIVEGKFKVVIGSRGAVFAPQPDLGLIIIDEEHEWTYKQTERAPRYHARDVAIQRAAMNDAVIILGSATPDVVTTYRAKNNAYKLLELPNRIRPNSQSHQSNFETKNALAKVSIVDLREELKAGNRSILSRLLLSEIKSAIDNEHKVILYVNKRGSSQSVQCRYCGFVVKCNSCSVPMTYHQSGDRVICHRCGSNRRFNGNCPSCKKNSLKPLGIGTQRIEQEVRKLFNNVGIIRWDSDTVRNFADHQNILEQFLEEQNQILIGTQMVAKGLDIPKVSLVGVVNADIGLNIPDLRAGERSFQLLCQVAGRAGRGDIDGKVIIQTYSPENKTILLGAAQNYDDFYEKEILFRESFSYPPFLTMARLLYQGTDRDTVRKKAENDSIYLRDVIKSYKLTDIRIVGPAPSGIEKLRGKFRWEIELLGNDINSILRHVRSNRDLSIDVDPVST